MGRYDQLYFVAQNGTIDMSPPPPKEPTVTRPLAHLLLDAVSPDGLPEVAVFSVTVERNRALASFHVAGRLMTAHAVRDLHTDDWKPVLEGRNLSCPTVEGALQRAIEVLAAPSIPDR